MIYKKQIAGAHQVMSDLLQTKKLPTKIGEASIVGIGRPSEGSNSELTVYLNGNAAELDVRKVISSISGMEGTLSDDFPINILRMSPIRLLTETMKGAHVQTQRPVCAGIAIGCRVNRKMGTLGFFVIQKDSAKLYFLTCRHIFGCIDEEVIGREIFQPPGQGQIDLPIGRIVADGLTLPEPADCVLVECNTKHRPHIIVSAKYRTRFLKYRRLPLSHPRFDQPVKKSGAKSGFSNGRVLRHSTISLDYPLSSGGSRKLAFNELTDIVTYRTHGNGFFALPGDSGSPVISKWAHRPVGLLLATYSSQTEDGFTRNHYLAQPLDVIMNEWNLTLRNF